MVRRSPAAIRVPGMRFQVLMALCFAGAWLTAESESWRLLHVTLGYTMAALVVFRVVWGLVGTRHARFSAFVRGPSAVARYVRSIVRQEPEHHTGHNPAGALAIVALLALAALITFTGWANYDEIALPWPAQWMEELHEGAASVMLALVGVHVLAVCSAAACTARTWRVPWSPAARQAPRATASAAPGAAWAR